MKTARFTQVVARSGRPHVHTLWVAPEKDPEFKRALEAGRVMTLAQGSGKTDAGFVGFDAEQARTAQFLVFPKSLKPFAGARVVGIKFDLVEQPRIVSAPVSFAPPPKSRERRVSKPAPPRALANKPVTAPPPAARADRDEPPAPSEDSSGETPAKRAPQREHPPRKRRGSSPHPAAKKRRPTVDESKEPRAEPKRRDDNLLSEVRHALKELEDGKAIAAYRRLERAVKAAELA